MEYSVLLLNHLGHFLHRYIRLARSNVDAHGEFVLGKGPYMEIMDVLHLVYGEDVLETSGQVEFARGGLHEQSPAVKYNRDCRYNAEEGEGKRANRVCYQGPWVVVDYQGRHYYA